MIESAWNEIKKFNLLTKQEFLSIVKRIGQAGVSGAEAGKTLAKIVKKIKAEENMSENEKEQIELKNRLKKILEPAYRADWMTTNDFDEFLDEYVFYFGGWDKFFSDIAVGVEHGYSVDFQLQLFEKLAKSFKNKNCSEHPDKGTTYQCPDCGGFFGGFKG